MEEQYSPAFWRQWKKGCRVAAAQADRQHALAHNAAADAAAGGGQKPDEAADGMDWLITKPTTKREIELFKGSQGEKLPKFDATLSRVPRQRNVDFSRSGPRFRAPARADPEPIPAPLPRPSIGAQVLSQFRSCPGAPLAMSTRDDWKKVHAKGAAPAPSQASAVGPGSYEVGGAGAEGQRESIRFGRAPKIPAADYKTASPGPVYLPAAGPNDYVRGGAFGHRPPGGPASLGGGGSLDGPGPANVPAPKGNVETGNIKGGRFSAGAQALRRQPRPTGLRARGCGGFGFGSNLDEFVKYGHSLEGGDSTRAWWEKSYNRVAGANGAQQKAADANEPTTLHYACTYGEADVVTRLLHAGGLVNAPDRAGRTPLHIACSKGFLRVAVLVLEASPWLPHLKMVRPPPDLDQQANNGMTCLHEASKAGHYHVMEKLLQHGVDPTIVDAEGKTAADYAANQQTFQVLAGANELTRAARPQLWHKGGGKAKRPGRRKQPKEAEAPARPPAMPT
jgi:hypothetical protein